jgi:putative ABC transport system ATP-binding protein
VKAVDNINLTIKNTGFYGIIGPSGAGKSSLLYLLAGFKKPTGGKIFFNGQEYPNNQDKRLEIGRKYMGYDFQRNFLISYLTVEENIFTGIEEVNDQILQNYEYLMRMINIWHLKDRFPHSISAGERQRVSIARCLIKNPKVAFFDEPTSYLNLENGLKTADILHNLSTHMAVVVVTHDNRILRKEDNVFQILDGKLISSS